MRDLFEEELYKLQGKGLLRKMRLLQGQQGPKVIIDGRPVINLCSNNYLGLAGDSRIKEAAIEAIRKYGLGSGASRLVCGNMYLHKVLEERLADFKEVQRCLIFNSGYMANLGIISSVVSRDDIVFSDRLNHASIIDGIILSHAQFKRYPHKDMQALEELLRVSGGFSKRLIVTDTVFSMDGDIASLPEIVELAERYDCLVMVDEAHATGVLGSKGAGVVEYFGLKEKVPIQMGTLSKALGVFGAYVCGGNALIEYFINCSRAFIYTTALPVAIAAASLRALQIIEDEPELRQRLWDNVHYLKSNLNTLGFDTLDSQTPIIPLIIGEPRLTMEFSLRLFEAGIFIQGIRPPTVPQGESRLRLTVMAVHSKEDMDFALEAIKNVGKQLSLI